MALKARPAAVVQAPAGRTPGRRLGLAILVLLALCIVVGPFFNDRVAYDAPRVRAGEVSYRNWGPLTVPVQLKGQWRMTYLTAPAPGATIWLNVPGPWEGAKAGGQTLTESGAAAYKLRIRDLPLTPDKYFRELGAG